MVSGKSTTSEGSCTYFSIANTPNLRFSEVAFPPYYGDDVVDGILRHGLGLILRGMIGRICKDLSQ
ncbi:hypothetical protein GBA52_017469 [Prunus armeniaca]|nr:hypothetical protein GBA52_017469 [Prunus armeniaca]